PGLRRAHWFNLRHMNTRCRRAVLRIPAMRLGWRKLLSWHGCWAICLAAAWSMALRGRASWQAWGLPRWLNRRRAIWQPPLSRNGAIRSRTPPSESGRSPLVIGQGQPDTKNTAHARGAFDLDFTAMRFDNFLGNRQTQANAAGLGRAGLIGTIEPVENVRQIIRVDADAGVLNFHVRLTVALAGAHARRAGCRGVLNGDVNHLVESFFQRQFISSELGQVLIQFKDECL